VDVLFRKFQSFPRIKSSRDQSVSQLPGEEGVKDGDCLRAKTSFYSAVAIPEVNGEFVRDSESF
jgi:hypothetical protein